MARDFRNGEQDCQAIFPVMGDFRPVGIPDNKRPLNVDFKRNCNSPFVVKSFVADGYDFRSSGRALHPERPRNMKNHVRTDEVCPCDFWKNSAEEGSFFEPFPGAGLLILSDGVHERLGEDRVHELTKSNHLADLPSLLVAEGITAGGEDNLTAVLCRFATNRDPARIIPNLEADFQVIRSKPSPQ